MDELVAWADRTAGGALTPHLTRCRRCRKVAVAMRLAQAGRVEHANVLDETFEQLQIRMRVWTALSEDASAGLAAPLRTRAAHRQYSALETFFGKETAERLLQSARRGTVDHRLMPAAEPLFHAFLGRKAAEALVRQIVGRAA
jgi:hypothetical protein